MNVPIKNIGKLFVIEGPDASGKTILSNYLAEILKDHYSLPKSPKVINQTSEDIMERMEIGLMNPWFGVFSMYLKKYKLHPFTLMYLEYAGRNEVWYSYILPRLTIGEIVVSCRFYHSEWAYGSVARGISSSIIQFNHEMTYSDFKPFATIILIPKRELLLDNQKERNTNYMYDNAVWEFHNSINFYYKYILPDHLDHKGRRFYLYLDRHYTKEDLHHFCIENNILI